jgi:hypothetical protein
MGKSASSGVTMPARAASLEPVEPGARHSVGGSALMLAGLLIALPGAFFFATGRQTVTDVPLSLDAFLMRVQAMTSPGSRLLVAGSPPAVILYRATYLLYPRLVIGAQPTDFAHAAAATRLSWVQVQALAAEKHTRYVVLWNMDVAPTGTVRLRMGNGVLAEVPHG